MPPDSSNDNGRRRTVDAHGQAALLLVESLIHGLITRQAISVRDAVEIVEIAAEAATEIEAERQAAPTPPRQSAALLEAISVSLRHDLAEDV